MFNVVPRMNCVTYWLVIYTKTKRKDRPFIFVLKFLWKKIKKNYNCQLKISKKVVIWWPGAHRVLFFWGPRSLRILFIWGTHITLSGLPECSGHSNKECPERSGSSNKEYPVCSGTWNNNLFADFQLLIVKNCDFFLRNFSIKMKGLSFLFVLV